jgi:uncharacterized protein (AIM24 family)
MLTSPVFQVIDTEKAPGALFEVVCYQKLQGSDDLAVAEKIFLVNQANIHLKMVRVTLTQSEIAIEPRALYFMRGDLRLESGVQGGLARGLMRKLVTGETLFQSKISGSGEVFLEPTFGHFMLVQIEDEALVVDKGAFYCASAGLAVTAVLQRNISSALFGGEGFFQTEIKGSGVVVLNTPVPASELLMIELDKGEKLSVDGNFAFARTSTVTFQAEKSAKTLFQSLTSGEALLQTFTGPGVVWIAPTQGVYHKIKAAGSYANLADSRGNATTRT